MIRAVRYWILRGLLFFTPVTALPACGPEKVASLPAPPAPAVEVKVAVPVACEIAQIPPAEDPAVRARKGDDVFTLAKIAAASRHVLKGENTELRAANLTPCPGGK
ncbi:hypothetical protein [Novosphingobium sp.]|uniref:hypothetical protein n=1 Tax=Novosphingobium sp. TaxID=1874826 RepID=UPI003D6D594B